MSTTELPSQRHPVAIIGHPNAGKTTLWNRCCQAHAYVSNRCGVTTTVNKGQFKQWQLHDLPGIYTLFFDSEHAPLDQQIAYKSFERCGYVQVINVIDCRRMQQQLYLTFELLDLGYRPIIIMHHASQDHVTQVCRKALDVPCLGVDDITTDPRVFDFLAKHLSYIQPYCCKPKPYPGLDMCPKMLSTLINHCKDQWTLLNTIESPSYLAKQGASAQHIKTLVDSLGQDYDAYIASCRYARIDELLDQIQTPQDQVEDLHILDRIMLHGFWGPVLFFMLMAVVFAFSVGFASIFDETIDIFANQIAGYLGFMIKQFMGGVSSYWSRVLGLSCATALPICLGFYPMVFAFQWAIKFLDDSGYFSRIGLIFGPMMKRFGMDGRGIIALLLGFNCNVNGILSTRVLPQDRGKIATIIAMPFIPCMARYTLLLLLTRIFFHHGANRVMVMLYIVSLLYACLTMMMIARRDKYRSSCYHFNDLVPLRFPQYWPITAYAFRSAHEFVRRSMVWIFPFCFLFFMLYLGSYAKTLTDHHSWLASFGFLLAPIGLEDHMPLLSAFIGGIAAKEIMLAILAMTFAPTSKVLSVLPFKAFVNELLVSLQNGFQECYVYLFHPWHQKITQSISINDMAVDSTTLIAYLLLTMITLPCLSTFSQIKRSCGIQWACFQMFWAVLLGYGSAWLYLCYARYGYDQHLLIALLIFMLAVVLIHRWLDRFGDYHVYA